MFTRFRDWLKLQGQQPRAKKGCMELWSSTLRTPGFGPIPSLADNTSQAGSQACQKFRGILPTTPPQHAPLGPTFQAQLLP